MTAYQAATLTKAARALNTANDDNAPVYKLSYAARSAIGGLLIARTKRYSRRQGMLCTVAKAMLHADTPAQMRSLVGSPLWAKYRADRDWLGYMIGCVGRLERTALPRDVIVAWSAKMAEADLSPAMKRA